MATCYAISAGEYSDYHVLAVFTTKELAESELPRYFDTYNDPSIEEFPLDPIVPASPAGMTGYSCHMASVSDEIYANRYSDLEMAKENQSVVGEVRKHAAGRGRPSYSVLLWARNQEHAIKIAAEKFAHQRAIDAGIAI